MTKRFLLKPLAVHLSVGSFLSNLIAFCVCLCVCVCTSILLDRCLFTIICQPFSVNLSLISSTKLSAGLPQEHLYLLYTTTFLISADFSNFEDTLQCVITGDDGIIRVVKRHRPKSK